MSEINNLDSNVSKLLLKLNSEKSSVVNLIKGVQNIIYEYKSDKNKTKILYESSYAKYNEVKNNINNLEKTIDDEKKTLFVLEKVLNINYTFYNSNEENYRKYISILENYEKKLRNIEIDIEINKMKKIISQLEKHKESS